MSPTSVGAGGMLRRWHADRTCMCMDCSRNWTASTAAHARVAARICTGEVLQVPRPVAPLAWCVGLTWSSVTHPVAHLVSGRWSHLGELMLPEGLEAADQEDP